MKARILSGLTATLLVLAAGATPALAQNAPEVCTGKTSCFMAFNGRDRGFCQAYIEGKSCFMSFNDRTDQGWCANVREGKSCMMALDGQARTDCDAGRVPQEHRRWIHLCRGW